MNVPSGILVRTSVHSFQKTVDDARSVLKAVGQTIFAEIDQAAAAASAGLHLRPTMLFVFGNPKAGTPLMDASPLVALDLPLKLLVWQEENGETKVAYRTMASLRDIYALNAADERFAQIDKALATLVEKIVTP